MDGGNRRGHYTLVEGKASAPEMSDRPQVSLFKDADSSGVRPAALQLAGRLPPWLRAAAGPAVLVSVGLVLVRWTWMAWPDAISDTGRELYIAWQLASGKVLYRDIAHFNGPLSQYADALWFRAFGASFRSLVLADLAVLCAISAIVYSAARSLAGRLAAFWACLVFLVVFAVGPLTPLGSFSYLAPYSHELTHGVLLLFLLVLSLVRYARRGGPAASALSGFLLGLLLLTKAEVAAAGLAATAAGLALAAKRGRGSRLTEAGVLAAAAAGPPLVVWMLLSAAMPAGVALRGLLGAWSFLFDRELAAMPYFRMFQGTLELAASLRSLLLWSLAWLAAFAPAWLVSRSMPRIPVPGRAIATASALAAPAAALAFHRQADWLEALRPLPVCLAALLALDLRRFARFAADPFEKDRAILRIVLAVASLALLARIVLFARAWHYGFVLAMPGTVLLAALLMGPIPEALAARGGSARLFRSAASGLVLAALAGHLALIAEALDGKTARVGSGADAFRTDSRGLALGAVLRHLNREVPQGATLAVLPDGVILNFLSRRPNPTPYVIGNPADTRIFGEDRMLDAYRACPPDYVALVHCDTSIYGYKFFGRDYAQRLAGWIASSYETVGRAGAMPFSSDEFGIVLLRRRDRGPEPQAPSRDDVELKNGRRRRAEPPPLRAEGLQGNEPNALHLHGQPGRIGKPHRLRPAAFRVLAGNDDLDAPARLGAAKPPPGTGMGRWPVRIRVPPTPLETSPACPDA